MDNSKILPARFFETEASGRMPVREWLLELPPEDRRIVGNEIRTAEFGWPVGMPLCRSIKGHKGLWEIRVNLTRGTNSESVFLCSRRKHGAFTRVHQEKPKNTGSRNCGCHKKNERTKKMNKEIEKGHVGGSFSDFLKEQGTYEETTQQAVKRVIAHQLAAAMKESGINKIEMAKQLKTSRSQLDRLLDPENDKVTLAALSRAAKAVGRTLRLELQ